MTTCDDIIDPNLRQRSWSKLSISLQVGKVAILDWGKHSCFTIKSITSKEIEVNISIFLDYSVLCWHIIKLLCDFVSVSILNLQFFSSFSRNLIVDCGSYDTLRLASGSFWEQTFYSSRSALLKFFLKLHSCAYKTLTLKTNSWLQEFYTVMAHVKLCKTCKAV